LRDAFTTPLWCHDRRRYIGHKVEAPNPVLRKFWALERAWGASGATGYRAYRGSRFCVVGDGRKDGEVHLLDFEGAYVSRGAAKYEKLPAY
jgi:hypothetical protein